MTSRTETTTASSYADISLATTTGQMTYSRVTGVPALLLTILLLGVLVLIACAMEDLPIDVEIFDGIGGIFKCTHRWWNTSPIIEEIPPENSVSTIAKLALPAHASRPLRGV